LKTLQEHFRTVEALPGSSKYLRTIFRKCQEVPYVYQLRDPVEEKPFFISKGSGYRDYLELQRAQQYYLKRTPGRPYQVTLAIIGILEKGRVPIVERIQDHLTVEEAGTLETETIKHYGRKGIDPGGVLINRTLGGLKKAPYKVEREATERFITYLNQSKGIKKPKYSAWIQANKEAHYSYKQRGIKHSPERIANMKEGKLRAKEARELLRVEPTLVLLEALCI
jgi:hypothetical protein